MSKIKVRELPERQRDTLETALDIEKSGIPVSISAVALGAHNESPAYSRARSTVRTLKDKGLWPYDQEGAVIPLIKSKLVYEEDLFPGANKKLIEAARSIEPPPTRICCESKIASPRQEKLEFARQIIQGLAGMSLEELRAAWISADALLNLLIVDLGDDRP